jgi:acyl-CoA thioesterase-1
MRILFVLVLCACGAGRDAKKPDSLRVGDGKRETGDGVAATSAAAKDSGSRLPSPVSRKTVLIVGTSITAGLGLEQEEAYPALLQHKADSLGLHVDIVNAGLSGETSAGALRRIDWLLRGPADVVVIETGANDGLRGLNVDSTRANLQAIITKVKAARPAARIYSRRWRRHRIWERNIRLRSVPCIRTLQRSPGVGHAVSSARRCRCDCAQSAGRHSPQRAW